jgi:hypothetical protein
VAILFNASRYYNKTGILYGDFPAAGIDFPAAVYAVFTVAFRKKRLD